MSRIALTFVATLLAIGLSGCGKKAAAGDEGAHKPADNKAAATAKVEDKAAAKPAAAGNLHDAGPVGDPVNGAKVYVKTCQACHQKDGKAMGGMLGADFIGDKTRLAKPDSELLKSIRDGKKGKTSVMPAHKDSLSEQEMKDALAYIRKTFGG